jgi:hypothetical protein
MNAPPTKWPVLVVKVHFRQCARYIGTYGSPRNERMHQLAIVAAHAGINMSTVRFAWWIAPSVLLRRQRPDRSASHQR